MPVVGTLTVNLEANTAAFSGDLGKAANDAKNFGDAAGAAGQATDFSMREARGSMMLVGEELGIHLPRELRTLVAEIPGIGMAFAAMLPIVGVVAAIAIVEKFIAKNNEAKEALAKGWEKASESISDHNDKLGVSIEKYKELIAQLEGRSTNGIALSLAEAKAEADELAKGLKTDIDELTKLLDKTARGSFMTSLLGASGGTQAGDVAKGLSEAISKVPHDSNFTENMKKVLTDSWQRAQSEINKNNSPDAGAFKNITTSNEALQQLQEKISAYHEQLDLIGQDDSLKKHAADLTKDAEAAKAAETAYNKAMDAVMKQSRAQLADHKKNMAAKAEEARAIEELAELQTRATEAVMSEVKKEADEKNKLAQEMYNEDLRNAIAGAKETESAAMAAAKSKLVIFGDGSRAQLAAEIAAIQTEVNAEKAAYKQRLAALDTFAKDYEAKKKALEDKITELGKKGDDAQLKEQQAADKKMLQDVQHGYAQMANDIAGSIAKSIVMHKSLAESARQMGEQMLQNIIKNMLLMKLPTAKSAAGAAYRNATVEGAPPMVADAEAILAFGQVMAFAQGGLVPGSGSGDTVPAMLSPGETVVSKTLTDSVRNSTTNNRGGDVHVHTTVHAVDAAGFEGLLNKHAAIVSKHVKTQLRKANKR